MVVEVTFSQRTGGCTKLEDHYCGTYGLSCWDHECFKPVLTHAGQNKRSAQQTGACTDLNDYYCGTYGLSCWNNECFDPSPYPTPSSTTEKSDAGFSRYEKRSTRQKRKMQLKCGGIRCDSQRKYLVKIKHCKYQYSVLSIVENCCDRNGCARC